MKKLLLLVLFVTIASLGQETEVIEVNTEPTFKITTNKGEVIRSKKYKVNEKSKTTDIQNLEGKFIRIKSSEITSIVEIKEGWDYFKFSEDGFTDYVVVDVDSLSKENLYIQVKNWVLETYNTPSEVIKSEIKNKKIRIEGSKSSGLSVKGILGESYYYNIRYSIEISVRDGKYKFDPISLEYYIPYSKYVSARWVDLSIFNKESLSPFYYQKGKKKGRIQSTFSSFPSSVENHFDNLNISLFNYINKNNESSEEKSDDDW